VKNVLVIDIGGSHVKLFLTGRPGRVKLPSGPRLTPRAMVKAVLETSAGWKYDVITIGYPGPIVRGKIAREPVNLGPGWVRFNFARALGRPVRLINDAAMQALGSYRGRSMLFLGLGTGLGTTLVRNGVVVPLEVAHLPYRDGKSFEEFIGEAGRLALGRKRWRRHVAIVVELMLNAFVADYAVLGGGNVRLLEELPPRSRRGNNANAFRGGQRLWQDEVTCT
jgi:predicted NBD/HSP70 family sugar kinase